MRSNSLLARLLIGAGFPLLLFLLVAFVGVLSVAALHRTIAVVDHSRDIIEQLLRLRERFSESQIAHRNLIRMVRQSRDGTRPRPDVESGEEAWINLHLAFQVQVEALRREVGDNPQQLFARLGDILLAEKEWHVAALRTIAQLRAVPADERLDATIDRELAALAPLARVLENRMALFVFDEQGSLSRHRAAADTTRDNAYWMIGVIGGCGMFLALFTVWKAARSVTRPVERLREGAANLIAGQFDIVPPAGPDEVAELTVHFNHMGLILTERAHSLSEQADRYQQYLGATTHLLWGTNALGNVTSDLPTWRNYTGQDAAELLGGGWLDAVHPDDRDRARLAWMSAVASRDDFEVECRLRRSNGEYRQFFCRAVPIVNTAGDVREWVGTCTDITETKREERFRIEKEEAEASSRAKTEFLTKMSHELRTPLNAVIGMSRMLATQRFGPLNAKQADYIGDIVSAGKHLLNLINDILDLAKVEAGKLDLYAERFDLGETVAQLVGTLLPLTSEKKLAMRRRGPEGEGALVTDVSRFRQILYNLLSNAIKFTAAGEVRVECDWVETVAPDSPPAPENTATAVRVKVCDTGIGIQRDEQGTIWDEFKQSRASRVNAVEGTGLGLALTRRLVALLGGCIWLESEPGVGSTFTVVLPRKLPAESSPAANVTAAEGRSLTLIVEDHAPTRKLLEDWLIDAGLATAWASDGEAGLALARERKPDLIILDVQLPGRNGWQVLTELKEDPRTADIPVVMVSVMEDPGVAASFDVQEYFVKPVERETFLGRLRTLQPAMFAPDRCVRVLVVDDDPSSRKLLADYLANERVEVAEAADGNEALRQLEQLAPDVIILDLLMPNRDGFDVVGEVRKRPEWQRIPIVVVTSKDLTPDERELLNGRIAALVPKHHLTAEVFRKQLVRLGLIS